MKSINPLNGKIIKVYKEDTVANVNHKIDQTHKAWLDWCESTFAERASLLNSLAVQLETKKEELARLMAIEMGKPIKEGVAEAEKCAAVCRYYAENSSSFLKDQLVETAATKSYISFRPIGVVLAVMPWNFPLWQVFRFLAPALMAGNCAVLKHAANVPGCAVEIEKLVNAAGFPAHVFQTLLIGSQVVGSVIEHPFIKAVTLTGSTAAGMQVAAKAGSLIKKTVLELGGSDPYLILEDADLESAAEICVNSRLINNGQSCIAAKRFIADKKIVKDFTALFIEKIKLKRTGNPLDPETDLGPMARIDLRDQLHSQVQQNLAMGAMNLLGNGIPQIKGKHAFYEPTVLSGIKKSMPAYSDELFGPVASIFTAKNTQHALQLANDTNFGLGAAVFTNNTAFGEELARNRLQAGSCFVNALVKSDPRLPFGGINLSGYGRELGLYGIHEFVNIKTVYVQ